MKIINEAKKAKEEPEAKITILLDQYSKEYNCVIENVDITKVNVGLVNIYSTYKTQLDVRL